MDKTELLYDHYKETYMIIKENIRDRNKFFLLFFIIMSIQFLFAVTPDSISSIIVSIIHKTYEIDISNQIVIIQSLLWLILLYFTMRYYQCSVYIERQYKYIHSLESNISVLIDNKFDRESTDYLLFYPKMNNMVDAMYKWVFPIIYCVVITIKIVGEFENEFYCFTTVFDGVIFVSCFVLTILYLLFLHGNK